MDGEVSKPYKQDISTTEAEPPYDSSLANKALDSNYLRLNRELFYVQELLNSNTSWELEHKIPNGTNMKLRGIFTEDDVSFQIAHTFGTGGMNDTIVGKAANFVKNAIEGVQAYAPVTNSVDRIGNMLGEGVSKMGNSVKSLGLDGFGGKMQEIGGNIASLAGDANNFLNESQGFLGGMSVNTVMNGKFLAASDLIKTYQGTDAKFSLPDLKCWIFHNSQEVGDKGRNVLDMVKAITSTCMGDLTDLKGVIGLQHAPGNYQPDIQVLNKSYYDQGMGMKGTWNLTMGGYTIYNLLVTNVEVTLSKFNAIDSNGNDSNDPLYAELKLSVEPASYISRADIFNTIMNKRSTQNNITYVKYAKVSESESSTSSSNSGSKSKSKSGKNSSSKIPGMKDVYNKQIEDIINDSELSWSAKSSKIRAICDLQASSDWFSNYDSDNVKSEDEDRYSEFRKEKSWNYLKSVGRTYKGYGKCKGIF